MENNFLIAPETDIYLLKVPFEMDNENVLTFSSKEAQFNYYNSLPKLELENATYQRKDGILRYPGNFDDLISYNYCMYRNSAFSNKWFYAFIEDIKFNNPGMTEIKLKTDVFATWQFDITYKNMFVVREHVNDDRVGLHTIPENLELGEYVCNKEKTQIAFGNRACFLIMAVSDLPEGATFEKNIYNGIYSGLFYLGFLNYGAGITNINNVIEMYARNGLLDAIQSIFIAYIGTNIQTTIYNWTLDDLTADVILFPHGEEVTTGDNITITRPTTFGGFNPKNNKLKTSPYMYMSISNNSGINLPFKYEDFTNNIIFKQIYSLSIGGNGRLIPLNYKGLEENYECGINMGKLPVCSWTGDAYTNWLTQQSVNLKVGVASLVIGGASSVISGGTFGGEALVGGIDRIGSFLEEKEKRKFVPDQTEGNLNSGDINFSYDYNGWTIYYHSIKEEYARIIDSYFTAYGYQVNSYKLPNITGRRNWNYVKTVRCNIVGDIPQKDIEEIKNIFNNGVTLWHNPNTFLDYTQDNSII